MSLIHKNLRLWPFDNGIPKEETDAQFSKFMLSERIQGLVNRSQLNH